jgi:hypothetical protein
MRLPPSLSKWISRYLRRNNRVPIQEPDANVEVLLTLPGGRKLSVNELRGLSGTVNLREGKLLGVTGAVRYEIIGAGSISPAAASLHQQGREAGERGDYKTAIGFFAQASEVAPTWPYPHYDRAYTHLADGRL